MATPRLRCIGLVLALFGSLAWQSPKAAAQNLLVNPSFEANELINHGFPTVPGDWSGDFSNMIVIAGAQDGIVPRDGSRMVECIGTTMAPMPGSSSLAIGCHLWQSVDLRSQAAAIDAGGAIVTATANFNRVAGHSLTDTLFVLEVYAFQGDPGMLGGNIMTGTFLAVTSVSVFTDSDVTTWETAQADLELPPGTDYVAVQVAAVEDVSPGATGARFDGHYLDDTALSIAFPPQNGDPSCTPDGDALVAVVGEAFSHTVTGNDGDADDVLTFDHDLLPAGAAFTTAAGTSAAPPLEATLEWRPQSEQAGEHFFTTMFTDAAGASASCTFSVFVNHAPDVVLSVEPLEETEGQVLVRLDGTSSSDADNFFEELSFEWTVQAEVDPGDEPAAAAKLDGALIDGLALDFGTYSVTLVVRDPLGAQATLTETVVLEPRAELPELSSVSTRSARVIWTRERGHVGMSGKIALPFGLDYTEIEPLVGIDLQVARQDVFSQLLETLPVCRHRKGRWSFRDPAATEGVRAFVVHWSHARFGFHERGFPVWIKSERLRSDESVLWLFHRKRRIVDGFSLHIGDRAVVHVAANGSVSTEGDVQADAGRRRWKTKLVLPFALKPDMTMRLEGGDLDRTIAVADGLEASTGRYRLHGRFDVTAFPDGAHTSPRTLGVAFLIGAEAFAGMDLLDEDALQARGRVWWKPVERKKASHRAVVKSILKKVRHIKAKKHCRP